MKSSCESRRSCEACVCVGVFRVGRIQASKRLPNLDTWQPESDGIREAFRCHQQRSKRKCSPSIFHFSLQPSLEIGLLAVVVRRDSRRHHRRLSFSSHVENNKKKGERATDVIDWAPIKSFGRKLSHWLIRWCGGKTFGVSGLDINRSNKCDSSCV